MTPRLIILGSVLMFAPMAAQGAAAADGAPAGPPSGARACRADAIKVCPEAVAAKDRKAAIACLVKKFDQISPECQALLKSRMDRAGPKPN